MRNVLTMFGRRLECLWLDTDLPSALRLFKQGKAHMALVRDVVTTVNKWVGACVCVGGGGTRVITTVCPYVRRPVRALGCFTPQRLEEEKVCRCVRRSISKRTA